MTRKSRTLWGVIAVLVIAVMLVMAACGPTPTPTPTPTAKPTATPSATPTASPKPSASPSPTVVQPKYGGTLNYPISLAPVGYDAMTKPTYGPTFTVLVFNNLVRYDPTKPDISPANIQGDLAESWTVAADGKSITFKLRQGVKWHDGSAFTADDVIYSLDKMADSKRSAIAGTIPSYDHTEKVDANTVKVVLKQPAAGFLAELCSVYAPIQAKAKAAVDPKTTDFLMGTGPYKFKSYTSGVGAQFVKNPDYFRKDAAGNKLPYLDGVNITIIADRSAQHNALITGQLDILTPFGGFYSQEDWDRIKTQSPKSVIAIAKPPQTTFLWLNTSVKPLDDVRVRKAMALVIEQSLVATAGYGSPAMNVPGKAVFAPAYQLPTDEINKLLGWDQAADARVAAAKKLMADAGQSSGFKLQLVGSQIAEYQRTYTYLSDVFKKNLNIDCTILLQQSAQARLLRDSGQFGTWLEEMISGTGDPDDVFQYFVTGQGNNISRYSNAEVDKQFGVEMTATSMTDRVKATQAIERQILTDVPVIPLRGSIFGVAWAPYVKGYVQQNASYCSDLIFEQVWLDK